MTFAPITSETLNWEKCPVCDEVEFQNVDYLRNRSVENKLHVCKTCGFIMYNPQPSQEDLLNYYRNDFRTTINHGNILTCNRKMEYHKIFLKKVLSTGVVCVRPLKVLDVGCAQGYLLKYLKDWGHKVYGLEHTAGYVDYARNIYDLDIYDYIHQVPEDKFDLIVCYHVLEHMNKPDEQLKSFHDKLEDEGYLYLSVPNGKVLAVSGGSGGQKVIFDVVFPQQHLSVFTEKSLRNILDKTGFRVKRINHSYYGLTVLCQKKKKDDPAKPLMLEDPELVEGRLDRMKRALEFFNRKPAIDTNCEKAISLWTNFPDAWVKLIMLQKEIDDQEKWVKKAINTLPLSASIAGQYGFINFRKYDWEEALNGFLYAHALKPADENIVYHIALTYVELRQFDKAKQHFLKTIELNPKMFEQVHKMLGWVATQYRK